MSVRKNQMMSNTNSLKKKCTVCGIYLSNQFEQILFLMKIDAQRKSGIGERQNKHQTWQQEDNTIYILCTHQ